MADTPPTSSTNLEAVKGLFTAARRTTAVQQAQTGENSSVAREMGLNRAANMRKTGGYGGASVQMAITRPTDPMFYWHNSGLPYDIWNRQELIRIRDISRMLYLTHPIIGSAIDIFCFAGETKVITFNGVRQISSLAGEIARVLTKGGKWVDAKFDMHGVDHLRKITLTRYGVVKVIHANPKHRWMVEKKHYRKNQVLSDVVLTDDLMPGMELTTTTPWRNELKKTNISTFGVAHGFVVGDGTREANGGCTADLHGEKDLAVLPYMNGSTTHIYPMSDGPTPRVYGLPGYFKDLPEISESASYLAGWLAGYFLADGTVTKKGQCFLDSSDLANLEFVRDVCTRLGVVTYPIQDSGEQVTPYGTTHMYRINIDSFDLDEKFFIGVEHKRRWMDAIGGRERGLRRANWRVVSVEETNRFEPVYCPVVPDGETFVLEDFILTGNTSYPLVGMEMTCAKSPQIADFYNNLLFDQLCNPPEAPIWMGDYSFKPLGEVVVGDEVIGWKLNEKNIRTMVRTKVLAVNTRWADNLVRVTMESGRQIVCTDDHVWANYTSCVSNRTKRAKLAERGWEQTPRQQAYEKRRMRAVDLFEDGLSATETAVELGIKGNITFLWMNQWLGGGRDALLTKKNPGQPLKGPSHVHDEWTVAFPGVQMVHVIDPTPDLTDEKMIRVASWLGGVYDGEGCGKAISQSSSHNPDVRERIKWSLDLLGIEHGENEMNITIGARRGGRENSHQVSKQEFVNFLNWTDPTRRVTTAIDKRLLNTNSGGPDRVVSVEPIGGGDVISMTTESGNYTAWGYLSKNCYEEFLNDLGREHWIAGEGIALGTFSDLLGTWENDEILLPEDVKVVRSPFLKEPRYEIKLPMHIRKIIVERKPIKEYNEIVANYPELLQFANVFDTGLNQDEDDNPNIWIPIDNSLIYQLKRKGDSFHERGIPILMRAFRAIVQEEMLNSAQDAVSSRLYTPLILARIGASATDLGTDAPWIPSPGDLDDFTDNVNAALAADFRMITHHFAVDIQNVFGRESIPQFQDDFDRLDDRILQAFGMSKTMLNGACLTGDTQIRVSRARKSFTMSLATLVDRFNGDEDRLPARKWSNRPEIETFVAREDGGFVRLGKIAAAYRSGIKPVFLLMTESGRSVRASVDHPFLCADGEWVRLGELAVGDDLQVNTGGPNRPGWAAIVSCKTIYVRHHPFQVSRGQRAGQPRYSILEHRAIVEAHLNGLSYLDFIEIVQHDEVRAKELMYLDPERIHVHHIDENRRNNDLANLMAMPKSEHLSHHADPEMVWWKIGTDRISSIEACGNEMTYDLTMADEPHNFIANDFVVHNSGGQTFAADALNRDVVTQLLGQFQRRIKRFVMHRVAVVAEAQGHYDFELRGGKPVPIMEEIVEVDPESGRKRVVQQPKLLLPELKLRVMNLKDDQQQHDFMEKLRDAGVPISMRTRLTNIPIVLSDEYEAISKEQIEQSVQAQRVRRDTYRQLKKEGLPIPDELKTDFAPKTMESQDSGEAGAAAPGDQEELATPTIGTVDPASTVALAPTQEEIKAAQDPDSDPALLKTLPRNRLMQVQPGGINGVPESYEQMKGMPRAASLSTYPMKDPSAGLSPEHLERAIDVDKDDEGAIVGKEDITMESGLEGPMHLRFRRTAKAFFLAPAPEDQSTAS